MSFATRLAVPLLLVMLIVMLVSLVNLILETTRLREEAAEMVALGNEMIHSNSAVIKLMEKYFIDFDPTVRSEYQRLIDNTDTFDVKVARLREIGLKPDEETILVSILATLDRLEDIEVRALAALDAGNETEAKAIITSSEYSDADNTLILHTKALILAVSARSDKEVGTTVNGGLTILIIVGSILIIVLILLIPMTNWVFNRLFWYDCILDSIPLPISVTDMNLKTTYINRPTEVLLKTERKNEIGRRCGDVWKASICSTEKCGVQCLRRGKLFTEFSAGDMSFKVDTSYLTNLSGKKIGHIEVVQDMTKLYQAQKEEQQLVKNINDMSDSFIISTKEIVEDSQAIAQGSTEQSAAVEELSSVIAEVADKTNENAAMAAQAANLSDEIKRKAEKGSHQMDDLMTAVKDITNASGQIERVIKVIDDIAFQTNILALNAAVEAARAGSAGKGFAVVAEEVRNLASKSAEAAKNTGGLIENSIQKANLGLTIANKTVSSLKEIVDGINQSADIITKIATLSDEQTSAIGQIDMGVNQVSNVIQQNTYKAEASAAASVEMGRKVEDLEMLLEDFAKK
jgi:methyl-accepting chemotaxis protein